MQISLQKMPQVKKKKTEDWEHHQEQVDSLTIVVGGNQKINYFSLFCPEVILGKSIVEREGFGGASRSPQQINHPAHPQGGENSIRLYFLLTRRSS